MLKVSLRIVYKVLTLQSKIFWITKGFAAFLTFYLGTALAENSCRIIQFIFAGTHHMTRPRL